MTGKFIRVIVADTQAIFRAGLRKIFALEDDIRVVGQAETLSQTLSAAKKFSADILIFEVSAGAKSGGSGCRTAAAKFTMRLVVVTPERNEELTLELFRRGAHGIVSREVEPELLVDCLRKVADGNPGSTTAASSGCSKPTATRARGRLARVPRFSSRRKNRSSSPASLRE